MTLLLHELPAFLEVCREPQGLLRTEVHEPNKCKVSFGAVISLPGEAHLLEQKSISAKWVAIRAY